MCDHIRIQVGRAADLVQQLRGNGSNRDESTCPGVFGHGKAAIAFYLCDGIAHVEETRDLLDKTIIAARTLSAAFNDVACGQGASERIIIAPLPVKLPRRRANDHRGIGDARADDNVCATIQRLFDGPGAKVGVGRDDFVIRFGESGSFVEINEGFTIGLIVSQVRN